MSRTGATATMAAIAGLIIAGVFALMAWQNNNCRSEGGHWKPTYGFQGICVSDDGRILP